MSHGSARADLDAFLARHDLDADAVGDLARTCRDRLADEVAELAALRDDGAHPVPDLTFDELVTLSDTHRDLIRRRGCVVVRGTFDPDEAVGWDAALAGYLERNGFDDHAEGSGIRPIYWSIPQIEVRQHPRTVAVRRALNAIWTDGASTFDADHDIGYADRIRRRPPGSTARGLRLHCDSPASGGWRIAENGRVFHQVLAGHPERHDPWDATHRTAADDTSLAPAGVFRTFQGWTALSEMRPDDGVLTLVPTLRAIEHLLIAELAREVGVADDQPTARSTPSPSPSSPAPPRVRADELVASVATRIPAVRPGDTVWWHGDLVHGVDDAANDTRWANVMYVPVSPRCPRNDAYGATMLDRFDAGRSPIDFPAEHLEVGFEGRATRAELNEVGREQFGIVPVAPARAAHDGVGEGSIGSAATSI